MRKLALAALLLGVVCLGLNNVHDLDEEHDHENHDQSINPRELDTDNDKFQEFTEEFEDDDFGEIKAIHGHVKYLDVARETLLKLALKLRKGKNVTNSFPKVIDNFEKEVAEFQAALRRRTLKSKTISDIEEFIKEGAKNRTGNTKILRKLTSQGLFVAERLGEDSKRSKRNFLSYGAAEFLNTIKEEIGEEVFEEYLSVSGLVTLMFVIDDTGSMSEEIKAAISISEQIVKAKRDYDVNYILSPFNDPETGPVTRNSQTEGKEFLKALRALSAHGGGDCPELTFTGMENALEEVPEVGSSMFVFTDASPKDAHKLDSVVENAHDLDTKINFFVARRGCGSNSLKPFYDVASKTNGRVYELKTTADLKSLGQKVVSNNLGYPVWVSSGIGGSTGRRKRTTDMKYRIPVDDSIGKITLSVTIENSDSAGVSLIDPKGKNINTRVLLTHGVVYTIAKPLSGVYKLIVPASAGKHTYKVSGVSGMNIDFGHYYVAIAKRGTRIPVPLDQPLEGIPAKAFVTIAGAESVKPGSMQIKVVDEKGSIHADVPMTAVGKTGVRYFVRFHPPSGPFKLHLYGQTSKGNAFVRESSWKDQTVPVLLKLSYKENSNILRRGQTTKIMVRILRANTDPSRQKYKLNLTDDRDYGSIYKAPRAVYRGRQGFAGIQFVVPADAPVAKTENVKLSLTRDGETNPVASLVFSFLLV